MARDTLVLVVDMAVSTRIVVLCRVVSRLAQADREHGLNAVLAFHIAYQASTQVVYTAEGGVPTLVVYVAAPEEVFLNHSLSQEEERGIFHVEEACCEAHIALLQHIFVEIVSFHSIGEEDLSGNLSLSEDGMVHLSDREMRPEIERLKPLQLKQST